MSRDNSKAEVLLSSFARGLHTSMHDVCTYLREHGDPQTELDIIHIAGTNGKGSVCQMISQVLYKQCGKSVGLFLSPHLITVHERLQINGVYITDDDLCRHLHRVQKDIAGKYDFSYFVVLFLASIRYFLEQEVDLVVYEVGLGGRLDATNIRSSPLATAITSIGLDHQRLLGKTLEEIQYEKMGIMKSGVPCYTPVDNALMHDYAEQVGTPLYIIDDHKLTNLPGEHQQRNAALAYHLLADRGYDTTHIILGLQQIKHPGRCQWLQKNLLVDGAHNREGIEALGRYVDTVRDKFRSVVTIFGTAKRVDEMQEIVSVLLDADEYWLVQPSIERGLDPALYKTPLGTTKKEPHVGDSIIELLSMLMEQYGDDTLIVVYGSLYMIGEILSDLRNIN